MCSYKGVKTRTLLSDIGMRPRVFLSTGSLLCHTVPSLSPGLLAAFSAPPPLGCPVSPGVEILDQNRILSSGLANHPGPRADSARKFGRVKDTLVTSARHTQPGPQETAQAWRCGSNWESANLWRRPVQVWLSLACINPCSAKVGRRVADLGQGRPGRNRGALAKMWAPIEYFLWSRPTEMAVQIASDRQWGNSEDSAEGSPGTLRLWGTWAYGPPHQTLTRFTVCQLGLAGLMLAAAPDPVFVQGVKCQGEMGGVWSLWLLFTA